VIFSVFTSCIITESNFSDINLNEIVSDTNLKSNKTSNSEVIQKVFLPSVRLFKPKGSKINKPSSQKTKSDPSSGKKATKDQTKPDKKIPDLKNGKASSPSISKTIPKFGKAALNFANKIKLKEKKLRKFKSWFKNKGQQAKTKIISTKKLTAERIKSQLKNIKKYAKKIRLRKEKKMSKRVNIVKFRMDCG
jgi:hypothetical protein